MYELDLNKVIILKRKKSNLTHPTKFFKWAI